LRKLEISEISRQRMETPAVLGPVLSANVDLLRLALTMGPNMLNVFLPSSEDGTRFNFQNVVFYSYLQFRTMDEIHKTNNSARYTLSCRAVAQATSRPLPTASAPGSNPSQVV
jgi:hypothetical protein